MNTITNILYWISTGLLVPVIVLLILFFIRALILVGSFFGRRLNDMRTSDAACDRIRRLTPAPTDELAAALADLPQSVLCCYAKQIVGAADNPSRIDLLIAEYEIEADKDAASSKVLAKTGPVLGLMGTLIPMGPALTGLSSGDIASMAYNMQVAFATTVVGLVISAAGFTTQQAKERRAFRHLAVLEYLADIVKQSNTPKK